MNSVQESQNYVLRAVRSGWCQVLVCCKIISTKNTPICEIVHWLVHNNYGIYIYYIWTYMLQRYMQIWTLWMLLCTPFSHSGLSRTHTHEIVPAKITYIHNWILNCWNKSNDLASFMEGLIVFAQYLFPYVVNIECQ